MILYDRFFFPQEHINVVSLEQFSCSIIIIYKCMQYVYDNIYYILVFKNI